MIRYWLVLIFLGVVTAMIGCSERKEAETVSVQKTGSDVQQEQPQLEQNSLYERSWEAWESSRKRSSRYEKQLGFEEHDDDLEKIEEKQDYSPMD